MLVYEASGRSIQAKFIYGVGEESVHRICFKGITASERIFQHLITDSWQRWVAIRWLWFSTMANWLFLTISQHINLRSNCCWNGEHVVTTMHSTIDTPAATGIECWMLNIKLSSSRTAAEFCAHHSKITICECCSYSTADTTKTLCKMYRRIVGCLMFQNIWKKYSSGFYDKIPSSISLKYPL